MYILNGTDNLLMKHELMNRQEQHKTKQNTEKKLAHKRCDKPSDMCIRSVLCYFEL